MHPLRCPVCWRPLRRTAVGGIRYCTACGFMVGDAVPSPSAVEVSAAVNSYLAGGGVITRLPYRGDRLPDAYELE